MRRRVLAAVTLVVALAACSGSDDGGDDQPDLTQLGAACGAGDSCASGLVCLTYTGFGGTELKSCEIPCAEDPGACPATTSCVTISDGPGAVCRRD